MIRALILLLQIAVLAAIAAWLADHPGRVVIHLQDWWGQDWRIDTSVAVLVVLAGLIALAAALGYRAWRFVWRAPGQLVEARRSSRRRRGYRALSDGMVALATGDAAIASRLARRADALLKQPPATQVLSAQAAEAGGDGGAARRHYEVLMEAPETAFIGVRGLLRQALEAGESTEALRLARRAYALRPSDEWVLNRLFELQVGAAAWNAADATLAEALRRKAVPQADAPPCWSNAAGRRRPRTIRPPPWGSCARPTISIPGWRRRRWPMRAIWPRTARRGGRRGCWNRPGRRHRIRISRPPMAPPGRTAIRCSGSRIWSGC
jgi:HemY protein